MVTNHVVINVLIPELTTMVIIVENMPMITMVISVVRDNLITTGVNVVTGDGGHVIRS